jgi:hypothetical protein
MSLLPKFYTFPKFYSLWKHFFLTTFTKMADIIMSYFKIYKNVTALNDKTNLISTNNLQCLHNRSIIKARSKYVMRMCGNVMLNPHTMYNFIHTNEKENTLQK